MDKKIEEFLQLSESEQKAVLNYETVAIQKTIANILAKDIETVRDDESPAKMNARRQLVELYTSLEYVDVPESMNGTDPKPEIERIDRNVRCVKRRRRQRSYAARIERKMFAYWKKNFDAIREELATKAVAYLDSKESETEFETNLVRVNGAGAKPKFSLDSGTLPKSETDIREYTRVLVHDKLAGFDEIVDLNTVSKECVRIRKDADDTTVTADTAIADDVFARNPKSTVDAVFRELVGTKTNVYTAMDTVRSAVNTGSATLCTFDALYRSVNEFALSVEKISKMIMNNCSVEQLKTLRTLQSQYYSVADIDRDKKSLMLKKEKKGAQNTNKNVAKVQQPVPEPVKRVYKPVVATVTAPMAVAATAPTYPKKKPVSLQTFMQQGPQTRRPIHVHEPFQPGKRPNAAMGSFPQMMGHYGSGGAAAPGFDNSDFGPPIKKSNLMKNFQHQRQQQPQQQQQPQRQQQPQQYHHQQQQQQHQYQPQHQQQHQQQQHYQPPMMPMNRMHQPMNNQMNEFFTRREPQEYPKGQMAQQQSPYYYQNFKKFPPY